MRVGGYEIVLKSTPKQFSGISLGMTVLFNLIGASIGPAIAGIFMQGHQVIVRGFVGAFPSEESYTLIFLTLTLDFFCNHNTFSFPEKEGDIASYIA